MKIIHPVIRAVIAAIKTAAAEISLMNFILDEFL
jgi:hypothetical protein